MEARTDLRWDDGSRLLWGVLAVTILGQLRAVEQTGSGAGTLVLQRHSVILFLIVIRALHVSSVALHSDDVTPRRPTPEGNLKTTLQLYTLHTDTSALGICKTVSC